MYAKDSFKTTPVEFACWVCIKYKPINHLEKLSSFKDTIIDHRSNDFDKDGTVKPWKANELAILLFLKIFLKSRVQLKPPSHVPECPLSTNSGRHACPKNLWERVTKISLQKDSDFWKRVPFSPVRERGLFFSPVREEVIIFERNISDLRTRMVKRNVKEKLWAS